MKKHTPCMGMLVEWLWPCLCLREAAPSSSPLSFPVSWKKAGQTRRRQWWSYLFFALRVRRWRSSRQWPLSTAAFPHARLGGAVHRAGASNVVGLGSFGLGFWFKLVIFMLIFKAGLSINLFFKTLEKLKDSFYMLVFKILLTVCDCRSCLESLWVCSSWLVTLLFPKCLTQVPKP